MEFSILSDGQFLNMFNVCKGLHVYLTPNPFLNNKFENLFLIDMLEKTATISQ